ncbi:hypothetical protein [Bradyrhizobium commune]|uniref:Uncharacterized protein n=1 Tax=Bradyrhizobium commune TaxID=83627 RepID=A0A7S9CZN1_9BRAD|nr:hypothetical protein [Bradyrhizobium commune]QPF88512.1 hypothetical protein IC761_18355 [Bradyrhizobium commune]
MEPAIESSWVRRIRDNAFRLLAAMKSENIGGLVSMAGSSLFLFGGDSAGIVISLSFLVAEIILTRYGHTRAGYSAGGLLFSFGDALAVISTVASGNAGFQIALALMAGTWLIGAARAPVAWFGERRGSAALVRAADALQPIVGVAILALRIPGIVTGLAGGNYIGAAAIACWGAADVLVGRLQDVGRKLFARRRLAASQD